MKLTHFAVAFALFASFSAGSGALAQQPAAQPPAATAPAATGMDATKDKGAISKACSQQADAKGLKGKARKHYRSKCKHNGGKGD
jgi:hypothetical protein